MKIPEYSVSLLFWIIPICVFTFFFIKKRLLNPEKSYAMLVTIAVMASTGIALDLFFAKSFFTFHSFI